MYSASQKTLDAEQKLRQQLEKDLETQKSVRQEKEVCVCVVVCSSMNNLGLLKMEGFPLKVCP